MHRPLLRSLARWVVGVLLLAQLAVASYACPAWMAAMAGAAPAAAAQADVGADRSADDSAVAVMASDCGDAMRQADPAFANLCAEHCKAGQQSDHMSGVVLPVAWLVALYGVVHLPVAEPQRRPAASALSALVAGAPPHAILHCVRRT